MDGWLRLAVVTVASAVGLGGVVGGILGWLTYVELDEPEDL